jgi:hypothetical protein
MCEQCHYYSELACENPACPQDKTGKQLADILTAQEIWIERQAYESRYQIHYELAYKRRS